MDTEGKYASLKSKAEWVFPFLFRILGQHYDIWFKMERKKQNPNEWVWLTKFQPLLPLCCTLIVCLFCLTCYNKHVFVGIPFHKTFLYPKKKNFCCLTLNRSFPAQSNKQKKNLTLYFF